MKYFEEFQDGYRNETILAILNLCVAPMPPTVQRLKSLIQPIARTVHTTGNSFDSSFSARPFNTNEMVPTPDAHRRSDDVNGGVSGNDSTGGDDGRTVDVENAVYRELLLLFRELP